MTTDSQVLSTQYLRRAALIGLGIALLLTSAIHAAEPLRWTKVTDAAGWQPRDSQGEVVFNDKLWLMGGWFQSFEAPPRDVWSSGDGKEWKLVQKEAPWKHSDLPMALAFKDRMWLMGGWYNGRLPGHSASSEVWSSTDGVEWKQDTSAAGWSPRIAAAAVVFQAVSYTHLTLPTILRV